VCRLSRSGQQIECVIPARNLPLRKIGFPHGNHGSGERDKYLLARRCIGFHNVYQYVIVDMQHMYKGIDEDIYCDRGGDFRTFDATDNYGICTTATVTEIMDHVTMLCSGYNGSYFGFVEVNDKNDWMGLDVDLCRALTTVILGGGDKAQIAPLISG
jgi:hypothetical protein